MENFESLRAIAEEFQVKQASLALFGLDSKEFSKYVEVSVVPHERCFSSQDMPTLVESGGNKLHYSTVSGTIPILSDTPSSMPLTSDTSSILYSDDTTRATPNTTIGDSSHLNWEPHKSDDWHSLASLNPTSDRILGSNTSNGPSSEAQPVEDDLRETISAGLNSEPFSVLYEDYESI